MQKFSTIASDRLPAVMLRTVIVAAPVVSEDTIAVYAPAVAPLLASVRITVSLAEMVLLFSVKFTLVVAFNVALFSVITPAELFSVTAVALPRLEPCVTVPCALAAYPSSWLA